MWLNSSFLQFLSFENFPSNQKFVYLGIFRRGRILSSYTIFLSISRNFFFLPKICLSRNSSFLQFLNFENFPSDQKFLCLGIFRRGRILPSISKIFFLTKKLICLGIFQRDRILSSFNFSASKIFFLTKNLSV